MEKKWNNFDNCTVLVVLISTCVVLFILSVAQAEDTSLSGWRLILFVAGFTGSILCIAIRFIFLYMVAVQKSSVIKKTGLIIYLTVWCVICVIELYRVMRTAGFLVEHEILSHYHFFQIFMFKIVLVQWLGALLFRERKCGNV